MCKRTFGRFGGSIPLSLLPVIDRGSQQAEAFIHVLIDGLLLRQLCMFKRFLRLYHKRIGISLLSLGNCRLGVRHGLCKVLTLPMSHRCEREHQAGSTGNQYMASSYMNFSLHSFSSPLDLCVPIDHLGIVCLFKGTCQIRVTIGIGTV
jgi:hypothetical protein